MKTQALGPFLGVNNRFPDFDLHVEKRGDYLRSGVNVDVDNKGDIHRAPATELLVPLSGAHSLYMTSMATGYVVIASAMYFITLPTYTQTLVKVLSSDDPVTWCEVVGKLFYSNGTDSGRVVDSSWLPAALPTPDTPTYSSIGGGLEPGWYQVATSYARYSGTPSAATLLEEGGVSPSANYERTTLGGIRVNLPPTTLGATHINVYLSAANGEVPYLLAVVPVGIVTYDCIALATGREASVRFEQPLPAGELFESLGRLCSIVGNDVYVGLPFRPGYYLPSEGVISFTKPVTLAVAAQGGTYVVSGETYWFPGDLMSGAGALPRPLPYSAVPGTAFKHPTKPLVGWFGANGVVVGDMQGQVLALTEEVVDVTAPVSGVSVVLETGGYRRVVSCGWCVNLESNAATSYTGWDFTSISGGYGTKSDGIYLLNSVGLVPWSVGLGKQNFGTEALKHMPAAYVGVNSDEPVVLTVALPDGETYDYPARDSGTDLQIQRIDTGKGLRANWYDLTLSGATGADFTLASVSFAPTASTRRI